MRILLLLLDLPEDGENMYTDLIDEFVLHGHQLVVMAPDSMHKSTYLREERGAMVLRVNSKPTQGVKAMLKKGINLALMPYFYKLAYIKFLREEKFDWIFMPTPPITLVDFVSYVKDQANAKFYLILRDIHPQSAASIGLIKYPFMIKYLERKARKAYELADFIGCMSQGNINFLCEHYPYLDKRKLGILMNWQKFKSYISPNGSIREIMNLTNKFVILFGGNIGKGQRIENVIMLAKMYIDVKDIIFLVIGKGVEKDRLVKMTQENSLDNIQFVDFMPREDYLECVKSVDVGLISINENYKVPTCPSKAVSYMSLKIPIVALVNNGNDFGEIIEKSGSGFWAVGTDKTKIHNIIDSLYRDDSLRVKMGNSGYAYYVNNLTSEKAYDTILEQIKI